MLPLLIRFGKDVRFECNWGRAVHLLSINKVEQAMDLYQQLYHSDSKKTLFLYNYGSELNRFQEYEQSIEVLNGCALCWSDYYVEMLLADNYFNLRQWDKSEHHFQQANYMCPNRFFPLYRLHEIYLSTDKKDKAVEVAKILIGKEVKVESAVVYSIKNRMKKYIEDTLAD